VARAVRRTLARRGPGRRRRSWPLCVPYTRPFEPGHGGDHSPEGISLLCRAHNHYLAEIDYGRQPMAKYRCAGDRASGLPDSQAIGSMVGTGAPGVASV
jgi:hypothetical protein